MSEPEVNLVIRGKMLVDGLGGPPISPGLVAVAGRKIAFAGSAKDAPSFAAAQVLEVPQACLLPGLIDMHVHPTYYWEEPELGKYPYEPEGSLAYSSTMITLLAASNLREALMSGVTTARDTGAVNGIMFEVRRAMDKGLISGPKLYIAGRLIVPTGGHVHYLRGLANEADGPYGFRRAVREEIRAGADYIKIANNGAELTQVELGAAVSEAHRLGKKVACHTNKPPSQRMAIEAGVDTFEHGAPTAEEIDLAVEKGIAWTPTLQGTFKFLEKWDQLRKHSDPAIAQQAERDYAESTEYLDRKRVSIEYAIRAGLKLVTGTDSWPREVRFAAIADEIGSLAQSGCTPMQAIQAATAWPAQVMDWTEIGTLEPGKLADMIAVDGDPLSDIRAMDKVVLVMREGKLVKGGSTGR